MRKAFILLWFISSLCYAGDTRYDKEFEPIPKTPNAPPPLKQKEVANIPHCEKYFVHQGKVIECDSNLGEDGEHLRSIMSDVPAAIAEMDRYQENRRHIKIASYVGSVGVLAMLVGIIISRPPVDPGSGSVRPGGYVLFSGFGVFANSLLYGLNVARTNQAHLGNAVNYYNAAHPDTPIELQFSTHLNF